MNELLRWPALNGALLLARGRADGLEHFPNDLRAASRSFWAAAICVPLYSAMVVLSWQQDRWPLDVLRSSVLEAVIFIIGWAGYAVISHAMLQGLGMGERWPRFIIVWNWVNVVQYALLLIATAPGAAGAPGWASETCQLVAQGWALWVEWYAIRLALSVSGLRAAFVMAPDVILGLFLAGLAGT